jgi:glutaredoxin
MTQVTLYTRPGCHLCEAALTVVDRVRADLGFDLEEVDIESDEALLRRFLVRIPVLAIDGEEAFELDQIQEAALRDRLARVHDG